MNALRPVLCWLAILLPTLSIAHPFHFSWTEVEYHHASKTVHLRIELFTEMLAEALSQEAGEKIESQQLSQPNNQKITQLITAYLHKHLVLKDRQGKPLKLTIRRRFQKADLLYLHLQASLPQGMAGVQMQNTLLQAVETEQVNYVVTRHQGKEIKLAFEKDDFKVITAESKK